MDCEAVATIAISIALGLAGTLFVLGLIVLFDTQQRRLKRASKKYKEENDETNRPSMRPIF